MRNQKKTRLNLAKIAGKVIALTLIMSIFTGVTELTALSCPAVEGGKAATAVSAEAAESRPGKTAFAEAAEAAESRPGETAFVDAADPAGLNGEKKDADKSIPDKIKEKLPDLDMPDIDLPDIHLPDLDFSKINSEEEKEKLREAVRKMDDVGISPERIVQRVWNFLNRKDNREKIDEAVEDIRKQVQEKTGKDAGQEK